MRVVLRALCVAMTLAVGITASAEAATTVGSSLRQRANLYVRCGGTCTAAQSVRPGGAGLTIPSDGVISRWRVRAATMGAVRLRILRREADGGYSALTSADWVRLNRPHEPGHDILYEFPTRLIVHAGDVIALDRDAKAGGIFHSYGDNTTYAAAEFVPALSDTAQDVTPSSNVAGRELLVNADVEKDDDGDGFGDESQDNCPTIPNDQTDKPCSTPTPGTGTPQGPTSTPVDTTPQTHTQGSQGPPVAGERPVAKEKRRHRARHRARKAPPAARDPRRSHSRRKGSRPTPRKPSRPESDSHNVDPQPRRTPVAHDPPTGQHDETSPRPDPPAAKTPSGTEHDQRNTRNAPDTRRKQSTHRHRSGKGGRPAPHPRPAPGWRHHSG